MGPQRERGQQGQVALCWSRWCLCMLESTPLSDGSGCPSSRRKQGAFSPVLSGLWGLLPWGRRKRGQVSRGHWTIHKPTQVHQTPGFVPSLGSHSRDPLWSRALPQFHLFIWPRWWVHSIPSECLKSLLSSPLPLQRLQEVRRNLDSASTN